MTRLVRGSVLFLVLASVLPPAAESQGDPPLSVARARLAPALSCPAAFLSGREPVLLVHGTAVSPEEHWGWNYAEVLPGLGYDVCTVRLPDRAMSDIQVASEYVVYAIRWIARRAGRRVDVIGHSQGALEPRWALRWWPGVRDRVDDYVGLAGPHHGTESASGACMGGSCFPAAWQMSPGSSFLEALNSGDETPGQVSYTSIFSDTDELVQPPATAILEGAANVRIQDLCPLRPVHHVGLNADAVVFALVVDALDGDGPVDPSRIGPAPCTETLMPGVTPVDAVAGNLLVYGNGAATVAAHKQVSEEPPVAPYVSE